MPSSPHARLTGLRLSSGEAGPKHKCTLFLSSSPLANSYSAVKAQPHVTSSGSLAPHHTCLRVS